MVKPIRIEDAFNDCIERILRGQSPEECLACYPEQAAELKPLLETMVAARQACVIAPRPDFRAHARCQFRNALADAGVKQPRFSRQWNWRLATVVPIALAVLLVSTGGVVAASAASMPGDSLYGVKLELEQVQLRFTPTDNAKTKLYAMMAERRVDEFMTVLEKGNDTLADSTAERLEESLSMVTSRILGGGQYNLATSPGAESNPDKGSAAIDGQFGGTRDNTVTAWAPPMVTSPGMTAASTTRPVGAAPSTQSPVTLPPINIPTPTITLPPGTTTVVNPVMSLPSIDPGLLRFLQENAANPAALEALLARVSESARPALLQAIALVQSYQQFLDQLAASSRGSGAGQAK